MKNSLLILVLCFSLFSCTSNRKTKMKCYKIQSNEAVNEFVYYYLIDGNSSNYYYYSSPSRVTDFSSITWVQSTRIPPELEEAEPESVVDESVSNLPDNMESKVETEAPDADSGNDGDGSGGGGDSDGGGGGDGD